MQSRFAHRINLAWSVRPGAARCQTKTERVTADVALRGPEGGGVVKVGGEEEKRKPIASRVGLNRGQVFGQRMFWLRLLERLRGYCWFKGKIKPAD